MLELDPPLSEGYHEIFKPLEHNLVSVSVLRGLTQSKVYVDSTEPTWMVTYSNSRILVSGDFEHPEAVMAVHQVVDSGAKAGRRGFVVYYPSGLKKGGIGEHIQGIAPYPNWRNYYVLEPSKTRYELDLPKGYRIEQITHDFLGKGYENTELVADEMQSERAGVDDFLKKSFGFCALKGEEIAAWCMSEYNVDNRFEIGIETHPDHRRKGLAILTAKACINHGKKLGFKSVGWHCWKNNEPSNRTSLRLGFKHVLEYPVEYLEVR